MATNSDRDSARVLRVGPAAVSTTWTTVRAGGRGGAPARAGSNDKRRRRRLYINERVTVGQARTAMVPGDTGAGRAEPEWSHGGYYYAAVRVTIVVVVVIVHCLSTRRNKSVIDGVAGQSHYQLNASVMTPPGQLLHLLNGNNRVSYGVHSVHGLP